MKNRDYYNYYEFLFSLRKEYLKNQKIINELLSYIKITNNSHNGYDSNLLFKTNIRNNIDSLLLIVRKRQSSIKLLLDSLYDSIVYCDPNLKAGNYSYLFRLSEDYIYLLDDNQDGRYINAKVEITNQKEFVILYKKLIDNVICKNGKSFLYFNKEFIQLSNNSIQLLHIEDNYKNNIKLDYNCIEDYITTNNVSYIENLMNLKINKDIIPNYYENIIHNNMDDYSYTIEGECNKNKELYTIEDYGKKIILKPNK